MRQTSKRNDWAAVWAFIALLAIPFVFSCGGSPEPEPVEEENGSFESFYQRFHEDTAYQMAHIIFPLPGMKGLATEADINSTFHWTRDGWKLHAPIDWDTTQMFVRKMEVKGIGVIEEYICTHDNFCILRRFTSLHDGWYLSYYEDMNYRGPGFVNK